MSLAPAYPAGQFKSFAALRVTELQEIVFDVDLSYNDIEIVSLLHRLFQPRHGVEVVNANFIVKLRLYIVNHRDYHVCGFYFVTYSDGEHIRPSLHVWLGHG